MPFYRISNLKNPFFAATFFGLMLSFVFHNWL